MVAVMHSYAFIAKPTKKQGEVISTGRLCRYLGAHSAVTGRPVVARRHPRRHYHPCYHPPTPARPLSRRTAEG